MKGADIIVGMQYGSEGKGKIAGLLSRHYDAAVRTGAPNAGHTTEYDGTKYVMRSVPCAWGNRRIKLYIGPGGLINLDVLRKELEQFPADYRVLDRLMFDRNAAIIEHSDIEDEEKSAMNARNGSTAEGVGTAQARKLLRRSRSTIGQHFTEEAGIFAGRITDVAVELNSIIADGGSVMLEGTQGFGLSLNHGSYPYVTSRDVIASSLLSDAGLPPQAQRFTFGVMRTYPIRVAGNSGPMGDGRELTWAEVSQRCGAPEGAIVEKTTVTRRVRRVSEIDWAFMRRSVMLNRPDAIFVNFIDYLNWSMHGARSYDDLTVEGLSFIGKVERELGVPVVGVSTGALEKDVIWTPEWARFERTLAQQKLALS